jgi:nitric oxide reductase NorD protein
MPEELEEQDVQDVDLTSFTQTEKKAHQLREAILNGVVRVYRYREYDADRGVLVPKHCTLYESVLESGDADYYSETIKRHIRTYRRLKKRFLMMQPEELELSRRWLLGDEIHLADAFDFTTDLMRGSTPDGKIYQRRKRNRRDIVAAVILDASSSTEERVDDETIISVEKQALCLLAGVLAPIGDVFGIFSYFSMGRHNNFFMIAKDFDEKWNQRTQGRIAAIEASSSNRDGCAIRHATARLAERQETTKLLLLLSDGIPADAGYGSTDGSATNDYAIEDTRRAIIEARIAGVVPYCITIDKSAKSYIPRLYGDYHYTVISSVSELPEKLSRLYLRLTR